MLKISDAISNIDLTPALVPFVTAGYPNLKITAEVIRLLDKQGVHAIEVGVPYSDALADGAVIQESSRIALEQNAYIDQVLALIDKVSREIKAPIIIFTYLNPILSKGIEIFVKEIVQSGAKGLVIPDLPLEESDYLIALCDHYGIELILFVAPSSSTDRVLSIISKAPGCIYLVSSYGVTGARKHIDTSFQNLIQVIKASSNKPIMLGFGISNELQVAKIARLDLNIDAIVIGTAFVNHIKDSIKNNDYSGLNTFCSSLKSALLVN